MGQKSAFLTIFGGFKSAATPRDLGSIFDQKLVYFLKIRLFLKKGVKPFQGIQYFWGKKIA